MKPIKLWGGGGPNPSKVSIIMKELGLLYEIDPIQFSDVKKPEYLAVNPNGRLPAIHDPNTGITLWESGAIIEYLIELYDKDHRLSFASGTPESFHAKQWLYFQTTGQGPYYGQAVWFKKFHPEQLPSAIERYVKEINRVSGVLDSYLAQQKQEHGANADKEGPWLVGNKMSYADFAFVPWQRITGILEKDQYNEDNFPHLKEWLSRMTSRQTVRDVLEVDQQKAK
ncbi:MAG: hypothetical protein Q9190_006737 [Brigantiaea leucoxantha]